MANSQVPMPAVNEVVTLNTVGMSPNNAKGNSVHYFPKFWILDSGAFDHVACSLALFSSYIPVASKSNFRTSNT